MTTTTTSEGLSGGGMFVRKPSVWFGAMALVFVLLGIAAILEPVVAGLAVTILVGWLLMAGGVAHLIGAFRGVQVGRAIWQGLIGLVYIAGGFYFATHPLLGLGTLTLWLAAIVLAEGIFGAIVYMRVRGERGSGWLLVNALIAFLLSGLIWFHWPSSSVWAIGTLVGAKLLMTGTSHLAFVMTSKRY